MDFNTILLIIALILIGASAFVTFVLLPRKKK